MVNGLLIYINSIKIKEMPNWDEEKLFFNALNLACESNFSFLSALKSQFETFTLAWKADSFNKPVFNRFKKQTIDSFLERKKEINPDVEWKKLLKINARLILLEEDDYPILLKETPSSPLGIYQLGEYDFQEPTIAMVGTRKCSTYGKNAAEKLSRDLVGLGITIISGLAYGIDTFSHFAALNAKGKTIAVMGTGLDIIFPSANRKLAEKIIDNGCLISEYPLSTPPLKHHFPERNRIISGLSLGTIVIECPLKSGSLITAKYALEQNREVFAVPGSIFSKTAEGTNDLIKSGAKLVNNVNDILGELNMPLKYEENILIKEKLNEIEKIIMNILSESEQPLNVDEIIYLSNFNSPEVNQNLTFLELKNLIQKNPNGYTLKH